MTPRLTNLQERIIAKLQRGLSICPKPFDELAKKLGADEQTVIREIIALMQQGIIRRISPLINYRALGLVGTLVAAHVPEDIIIPVANAVNALPGVSHNYRRHHHYNLWFTLQSSSLDRIDLTLKQLADRFNLDFHSMPVEHTFKLDVRFDFQADDLSAVEDLPPVPTSQPVELDTQQKSVLSLLNRDLEVTSRPFDFLLAGVFTEQEVLTTITDLIDKGVIRRIAAVVDHRKLGFTANLMFCAAVPDDRIIEVGSQLARFRLVSHCYKRKTFELWPFNLYAMMHARTMEEIRHLITKFTGTYRLKAFELLPTIAEFKKQPVNHPFTAD